MIYVTSDIHGEYGKYRKLLRCLRIDDMDDNTLYILGDLMDRGPEGLKVLADVMHRKNVIALLGNHDYLARCALQLEQQGSAKEKDLEGLLALWFQDGGEPTWRGLQALHPAQKAEVLQFLQAMPLYAELMVNGQKFFLSHTVPGKEKMAAPKACCKDDYIWGKPDYTETYFEDTVLVTGHTPTGLIDPACSGKIFKGNNHIGMDCGAVFGHPLGCICLDTMEELSMKRELKGSPGDEASGIAMLPPPAEEWNGRYAILRETMTSEVKDLLVRSGYQESHRPNFNLMGYTRIAYTIDTGRKYWVDAAEKDCSPISFTEFLALCREHPAKH